MAVKEINDANFEEEVSQGNVVVDCFASWCGPCRMLAPIIEELSEEITSVKFCKLDVDESSAVPSKYAVFSIPTLLFFKDGKLIKTLVGYHEKKELEKLLK